MRFRCLGRRSRVVRVRTAVYWPEWAPPHLLLTCADVPLRVEGAVLPAWILALHATSFALRRSTAKHRAWCRKTRSHAHQEYDFKNTLPQTGDTQKQETGEKHRVTEAGPAGLQGPEHFQSELSEVLLVSKAQQALFVFVTGGPAV